MKFYVGGRDNSATMQGVSICVRMPNVTDIRTSTNVELLQISEILMRQLNEYFHSYVLDEDVSVWGRGWHCSHLSPMKRYRHVLVSLQTAHSCWISSVRGVLKPHSLMSMIWLFLISQVLSQDHFDHVCIWQVSLQWWICPTLQSLALYEGNIPVTDGFPSQRAIISEKVSISWWNYSGSGSVVYYHSVLSEWMTCLVLYGWTYGC